MKRLISLLAVLLLVFVLLAAIYMKATAEPKVPTATGDAFRPIGTMPSMMPSVEATESAGHPTIISEDESEGQMANNRWLLWLMGIVIVGASAVVVMIIKNLQKKEDILG